MSSLRREMDFRELYGGDAGSDQKEEGYRTANDDDESEHRSIFQRASP